jgi:hypothetical protein
MTTTGTTHARRALVEGAWASRDPATGSRHRQRRRENHPNVIQDLSWKAHVRLCQRYRRLMARGNHATPVVVAMARELVGWMWAMAKPIPVTPSVSLREGEAPQLSRLATAIGRGAAPVWCHPRRRSEAETNPRASSAAGPRRTPVRWSPTHGEQPDHPSDLPGAGSSAGRKWT